MLPKRIGVALLNRLSVDAQEMVNNSKEQTQLWIASDRRNSSIFERHNPPWKQVADFQSSGSLMKETSTKGKARAAADPPALVLYQSVVQYQK